VAKARPDAVIVWFDAHGDLHTPDSSTSGYLGGMAMSGPAGLWDSELGDGLDLGQVILVGARDLDPAEKALVAEKKVQQVSPGWGMARALEKALAGRPAYVHLDCDVLKPGLVPTEFTCSGGMSLKELAKAAKVIAKGEVVGLEIAELQTRATGALDVGPLLAALEPLIDKMRA
jgi:arginase family enzyme